MVDGSPLHGQSLQRALREDLSRFGPSIPMRIVASPDAPVGEAVTEIADTGFWKLTFVIDGETNAIAFMPRPDDIHGPPVHEIAAIVSSGGTITATNSPAAPTTPGQHPWGTRVFFRATPETLGKELYRQMAAWETQHADLYWDDSIRLNQASQTIGAGAPRPER